MTNLDGKVAIVTGASRGLGAAVARQLDGAGVRLGLASRAGDDLGIAGAVAPPCDVTDAAQVQALTDATVAEFGRLDILVANAGIGIYGDFAGLSVAEIDRVVDVNLKGTLYAAHAAIPHLAASGAGDLVTIASVAGLRGLPGEAIYSASKFGQVGFTRALDHELMPKGVRCTTVAPGGIATEFAMGHGRTPDMPELATMMSPDEVAEVVLFVLTRPRSYRLLTASFRPMGEESWG
jgi:NADP-dependent 3-hydroxy acid dehydrogenase YdfG